MRKLWQIFKCPLIAIFSVYRMIKFAMVNCSENPGMPHMAFAQYYQIEGMF